jgi:hypothetical protein
MGFRFECTMSPCVSSPDAQADAGDASRDAGEAGKPPGDGSMDATGPTDSSMGDGAAGDASLKDARGE